MSSQLITYAKVIVVSRGLLPNPSEIGVRTALRAVPIPPAPYGWHIHSQLYNNAELIFDEAFCHILTGRWSLLELAGLSSILQHPESSVLFASSTGYQLRGSLFSPLWGATREQVLLTTSPEGT